MECNDKNCPTHGGLKVRGITLKGKVVSDKMKGSVVVERELSRKDQKYERYVRSKSRITAHKPACMKVKVGDIVEISETKKLSKTKNFVITKVVNEE